MNDLAIDFAIIQNHRLQFLVGIGLANKNELAAIRPFRCQQRIYLVDIETGRAAWGWSKDPVNDDLLGMAAAVGFDPDDVLEFWILEGQRPHA